MHETMRESSIKAKKRKKKKGWGQTATIGLLRVMERFHKRPQTIANWPLSYCLLANHTSLQPTGPYKTQLVRRISQNDSLKKGKWKKKVCIFCLFLDERKENVIYSEFSHILVFPQCNLSVIFFQTCVMTKSSPSFFN